MCMHVHKLDVREHISFCANMFRSHTNRLSYTIYTHIHVEQDRLLAVAHAALTLKTLKRSNEQTDTL